MNKFSSTATAAFISTCLFLSAVIGASAQQIEWRDVNVDRYQINEQAIMQASRVLGFVSAQNAAVDTLAQQYPQAAGDLIKQKLMFEAKFGFPEVRAEALLREHFGAQYQELVDKYITPMTQKIRDTRFTFDDMSGFYDTLQGRNGSAFDDQDVLPMILWLKYADHPGSEMKQGWVKEYSSGDDPKSAGVDIHLSLPVSWKGKPGRRPHIVQRWVDQNGTGMRQVQLMQRDVTQEMVITDANLDYALKEAAAGMAEMMDSPPEIQFVHLDSQKFAKIEGMMTRERNGVVLPMWGQFYATFYKSHLVFLQCLIPVQNTQSDLDLPADLKPGLVDVCDQVANSLIIANQWKP